MIVTARQFYRDQHAMFAVYVSTGVSVGWVADTGVGGTFSWNVDDAKWWRSEDDAVRELIACDLINNSTNAGPVRAYFVVRVR